MREQAEEGGIEDAAAALLALDAEASMGRAAMQVAAGEVDVINGNAQQQGMEVEQPGPVDDGVMQGEAPAG